MTKTFEQAQLQNFNSEIQVVCSLVFLRVFYS